MGTQLVSSQSKDNCIKLFPAHIFENSRMTETLNNFICFGPDPVFFSLISLGTSLTRTAGVFL